MTGFLSQEDLEFLTDYHLPAWQRKWLDQQGIPYRVGASGRPKVLWSDLERQPQRQERPDWSAVR